VIAAMIDRIWRAVPRKLRELVVPADCALRRIGRRWRHSALPHDAIYTAAYFAWVDETARTSANAIATSIVHRFAPLYAHGGHAFCLRRTQQAITAWPQLVETWLRTIGMISE
jgi:hypothetical protein